MIPFPKIVIFELVEYQCEYPKYYIRAYEKKSPLDCKLLSKCIYLLLKGQYQPLSEKLDYEEKVQSVDAFFGSKAHYVLA